MTIVEVIDHYIDKCTAGFPIDKVREELKEKNYNDDDIWFIIREVDNYLLNNKITGEHKKHLKSIKISGVVIMSIGLLLWFSSYTGLLNLGNYLLIPYGMVISGAGMYYGIKWLA